MPATLADLPGLAALEQQVFPHGTYPDFFFRQALELWPGWLWCARGADGAVAAYALAAPARAPGEAWLLSAATHPAQRGRGLGNALLTALLDALRTSGVATVRLTVHPDNPARRLYARHGFVVEDEQPDYFGPGEPRVLMRLALAPVATEP